MIKGLLKKKIIWIPSIFLLVLLLTAFLFDNGIFCLNSFAVQKYPVRGVDVSAYQGDIDWSLLAAQNIDFAYIKATEGSSHVDRKFAYNWQNAAYTRLRIGAYHFFSFDSAGSTQADNYIKNVTAVDDMLPPVVDVEFYGDKSKNLPDHAAVVENLCILLLKLQEHYGMKPVIYATSKAYRLYISEHFEEYDIWIRDVYKAPALHSRKGWIFWQYSQNGVLRGYTGEEKHIDMNVFFGTEEQFLQYSK